MTDLNDFVIDAWIEECEREDNPADFIQRFFEKNKLKDTPPNAYISELEEWAAELFELMGVNNDRIIKLMFNTMDWKLIENIIQSYYDNELIEHHEVVKPQEEPPLEDCDIAAQEFFAIIDKEMKEQGIASVC